MAAVPAVEVDGAGAVSCGFAVEVDKEGVVRLGREVEGLEAPEVAAGCCVWDVVGAGASREDAVDDCCFADAGAVISNE